MSATVHTPHGEIAYRDFGEGEPIVFVHGLLVDGRLWSGVAEPLAANHRCIVPEWPVGSHRIAMNEDADLTPPGLAQIIVAFMDALRLERATIVGNDTGGAISQVLAANHPERVERLVLTNCDMFDHFPPFPFNGLPLIARLPGGVTALQVPNRLAFVRRMGFAPLVKKPLPQELIDSWLEPAASDKAIKRDLTKVLRGVHKRHTLAAAEGLRAFPRPIRFAWGADDRLFKRADAERLATMAPDVRIADIPDARTFVPLDQPERVAEQVAEFVAEGAPAGA